MNSSGEMKRVGLTAHTAASKRKQSCKFLADDDGLKKWNISLKSSSSNNKLLGNKRLFPNISPRVDSNNNNYQPIITSHAETYLDDVSEIKSHKQQEKIHHKNYKIGPGWNYSTAIDLEACCQELPPIDNYLKRQAVEWRIKRKKTEAMEMIKCINKQGEIGIFKMRCRLQIPPKGDKNEPIAFKFHSFECPRMGYTKDFDAKYRCTDISLGEGGHGAVFEGIRIADQHPVAIKKTKKATVVDWGLVNKFHAPLEYCLLNEMKGCSGVNELLDAFRIGDGYFYVLKRLNSGCTLLEYMEDSLLKVGHVKLMLRELVNAVQQCHDKNIFHRDIKEANILIDLETGMPTLIDFGLAALAEDSPYGDNVGTVSFMAPEMFKANESNKYDGMAAAVYSLGVVFYDMIYGAIGWKPIIFERQEIRKVPFQCLDLMNKMLAKCPEDRPSFELILKHPWMKT